MGISEFWLNLQVGFLESFAKFQYDFYKNFIAEGRWKLILKGLGITIEISFFAVILGTLIGVVIAFMKLSKSKLLHSVSGIYIDVIRGTPSMVQLLIINFVVFASVSVSKVFVAVVAFAINSGAYVAEIIRAGILSIDKGQTEAGRSLGLSGAQTMIHIILPQAIKNILPALGNEFIVLIKETAVAGYIGAEDLNKVAAIITSRTYSAFYPLIGIAVIYFILIKMVTYVLRSMEKRLRKSDVR